MTANFLICVGDYHRDIEHRLAEAQALLCATDACQLKALSLIRWQLLRTLTGYQRFKHETFLDPLIGGQSPQFASRAADLRQSCIEVGNAYRAHVEQWSRPGLPCVWTTYCAEARKIIGQLREYLQIEHESLKDLVCDINQASIRLQEHAHSTTEIRLLRM